MQRTIAVLTGDIVGSGDLPAGDLDRLFAAVDGAVAAMAGWPDAPELVSWSRYRGDGWQLVLGRPEWSLRACLFVRAAIRAAHADFETRAGVGIGAAGDMRGGDVGSSVGEAFQRSGRCLDGLRKHFLFGVDAGPEDGLLESVFVLADALSRGWTARQAEVLGHLLAPDAPNQADVGARLSPPIGQPAVTDHYLVGHGPALLEAIAAVEAR